MMRPSSFTIFLLIATTAFFVAPTEGNAQLREHETRVTDLSGPILGNARPSKGANLGNLFNMQMSHSYSMNFGAVGGQMLNMNAYTNTMRFFFSEKLTGRLDLSLLHSPFGNSSFYGPDNGQDVQFILRNAELNYQISDKSSIQLRVNQLPAGYGYGNGFGGFGPAPFRMRPFYNGY